MFCKLSFCFAKNFAANSWGIVDKNIEEYSSLGKNHVSGFEKATSFWGVIEEAAGHRQGLTECVFFWPLQSAHKSASESSIG